MKKTMRLLALTAVLTCLLGASPGDPKEGEQYFRLKHPVAGVDARQVVEVFWYDCPDSYAFEKPLENWARQHPAVKVVRIPAAWPDQPDQLAYARLFYTLDRLGLAEREAMAVFHAVRDRHQSLTTEKKVLTWAATEGLDVDAVRGAYRSRAVADAVKAAPALRERYQVVEEPTMVVGGRFRTSPFQAGGDSGTIAVLDHLYRTARSS